MITRKQLSEAHSVHHSIMVDATVEKFGYDPRQLKPSSEKLVVKKFECCGKIEERKFRAASNQHKCLNCSNRDNARGDKGRARRSEMMKIRSLDPNYKHPTKGIGHSAKAKAKIRAAVKNRPPMSAAMRAQFSIRFSGQGNSFYGKKHKPGSLRVGKDSPLYGRTPPHAKKVWYMHLDGYRVCFRSTWEAKMAYYLDQHGIPWEYESKLFPVFYDWNGGVKQSTYRADFWLPCSDQFIEVKGYFRAEYLKKFQALKKQYPNVRIELWDREVLKGHSIDV